MIRNTFIVLFFVLSLLSNAQENNSKVKELGLVFSNLNSFGIRYKFGSENGTWRLTSLFLNGSNSKTSNTNYSAYGSSNTDIPDNPSSSLGLGLNFGYEKRNWINKKAYFYYGVDLINSYSWSNNNSVTPNQSAFRYYDNNDQYVTVFSNYFNTSNTKTYSINSGIGIVLGFGLQITDQFTISAELIPSISYRYTKTKNSSTNNNVQWNGNSSVGYTASYTVYNISQEYNTKGITYGLSNSGASITLTYKLDFSAKK